MHSPTPSTFPPPFPLPLSFLHNTSLPLDLFNDSGDGSPTHWERDGGSAGVSPFLLRMLHVGGRFLLKVRFLLFLFSRLGGGSTGRYRGDGCGSSARSSPHAGSTAGVEMMIPLLQNYVLTSEKG